MENIVDVLVEITNDSEISIEARRMALLFMTEALLWEHPERFLDTVRYILLKMEASHGAS